MLRNFPDNLFGTVARLGMALTVHEYNSLVNYKLTRMCVYLSLYVYIYIYIVLVNYKLISLSLSIYICVYIIISLVY